MKHRHGIIQYDEGSLEHNDCPPLAISEWQQWGDASGAESTKFEEGYDFTQTADAPSRAPAATPATAACAAPSLG